MMAQQPPAAQGHAPAAQGQTPTAQRQAAAPSSWAIYWRYLIFWILLFGLLFFISLYGIVAEA
jgi:hypothetical protein